MCAGAKGLGPASSALSNHEQGVEAEEERLGHELELVWDVDTAEEV